jgi:hypothetical protein
VANRWLILTGHSPEYNALGELTVPNHVAYARRHGYAIHVHHHERGNGRADAWDKARWRVFLALLGEYDCVCTIGADALFLTLDTELDAVFAPGADQQMAEERIGGCTLNNDVAFWRSCESTRRMVRWFLDNYDEHLTRPLGYQAVLSEILWKGKTHEQWQIVESLRLVDPHVMNTCPQLNTGSTYTPGDFIIHFMGAPLDHKVRLARIWLEEVQR